MLVRSADCQWVGKGVGEGAEEQLSGSWHPLVPSFGSMKGFFSFKGGKKKIKSQITEYLEENLLPLDGNKGNKS